MDVFSADLGWSGISYYGRINRNELVTLPTNYRTSGTFAGGLIMSLQEWIALAIAAGTLAALVGAFWMMSSPDDRKR